MQENDTQINSNLQQAEETKSKSFSEASKIDFKPLSDNQQYNIPTTQRSNEEKGLRGSNFITLGKTPKEDRIEIIKTGFERQAEGIISLKEYYESTDPYSLFQLKGYSIKYETIRRTKLYQQLKLSNN